MKMKKMHWVCAVVSFGVAVSACGSEESGSGGSGDGDSVTGDGDGDTGDGDGDGDGDSLDQGSLAANCSGLTAAEGESCEEQGLVCVDERGDSCVCGGLVAGGNGDGDFGGPSRPGNGDNSGSGVWECFGIGSVGSGGTGEPGDGDGDGDGDGAGGSEQTGGADGSGGEAPGGQGGVAPN